MLNSNFPPYIPPPYYPYQDPQFYFNPYFYAPLLQQPPQQICFPLPQQLPQEEEEYNDDYEVLKSDFRLKEIDNAHLQKQIQVVKHRSFDILNGVKLLKNNIVIAKSQIKQQVSTEITSCFHFFKETLEKEIQNQSKRYQEIQNENNSLKPKCTTLEKELQITQNELRNVKQCHASLKIEINGLHIQQQTQAIQSKKSLKEEKDRFDSEMNRLKIVHEKSCQEFILQISQNADAIADAKKINSEHIQLQQTVKNQNKTIDAFRSKIAQLSDSLQKVQKSSPPRSLPTKPLLQNHVKNTPLKSMEGNFFSMPPPSAKKKPKLAKAPVSTAEEIINKTSTEQKIVELNSSSGVDPTISDDLMFYGAQCVKLQKDMMELKTQFDKERDQMLFQITELSFVIHQNEKTENAKNPVTQVQRLQQLVRFERKLRETQLEFYETEFNKHYELLIFMYHKTIERANLSPPEHSELHSNINWGKQVIESNNRGMQQIAKHIANFMKKYGDSFGDYSQYLINEEEEI
jgi:hypothetical protein